MSRNVHDLIGYISEMLDEVECEYIDVSEDRDYLQRELKEFKEKDKEFPKAYDLGYEEGFAKGEQSMQEKANKIIEFYRDNNNDIYVLQKVFSLNTIFDDQILEDIEGAYNKIIEYEKKEQEEKEIHVGDEVKDEYGEKYIVRKIDSRGIYLLRHNGEGVLDTGSNVSKTGKHYPLEEMLKELK